VYFEKESFVKRIAVFASGSGSNLQSLIDACNDKYLRDGYIELVFSNKKDAYALERAIKAKIKTLYFDPKEFKTNEDYDQRLAESMNEHKIDIVCLAGYMKILTKKFLDTFKGKIMNIHPALLPSFGGKGYYGLNVHEKVLEYGAKVTGATVHFVDYGADTGPIILQKAVNVEQDDTPETLQKRVLKIEHEIYKEALKYVCQDRCEMKGRRVIIKSAGKFD
jgi:phosphoribosylglycinamide formyltransferase 1